MLVTIRRRYGVEKRGKDGVVVRRTRLEWRSIGCRESSELLLGLEVRR
jgi:hypothetical protein